MKLRKFQLSCPVFWGYNKYIDLEKYNNLNDILIHVLNSCEEFFKSNNLIDLVEFFKSIKHLYHILKPLLIQMKIKLFIFVVMTVVKHLWI